MAEHILFLILAATLLWVSADWIVDSAVAIARSFRIPELVIGLTVVAMGTSAPEFLVTLTAALKGANDISLSNIVGSNIFNLGIILGLVAALRPLPATAVVLWRDGCFLFIVVSFILLCSVLWGYLPRIAGALLLVALICYTCFLIFRRPEDIAGQAVAEPDIPKDNATGSPACPVSQSVHWKEYAKLLAGFAGISLGGNLMVEHATAIAASLGVSTWVIGVTIVAGGTSLPELVTCLSASLKGRSGLLLGNLIGSDIFNFAGVLGLTSVLQPLAISAQARTGLLTTLASLVVLFLCIRTGWRISRTEGILLLCIAFIRWLPGIVAL